MHLGRGALTPRATSISKRERNSKDISHRAGEPSIDVGAPDGQMWVTLEASDPYIVRVKPEAPAGGWPRAPRPVITRIQSGAGGIRVSVRCRGIPGLYCGGNLTLAVRAAHRAITYARTLVIAAAGQGVELTLRPHGLSALTHQRVAALARFTIKDFLGRRSRSSLQRRLWVH